MRHVKGEISFNQGIIYVGDYLAAMETGSLETSSIDFEFNTDALEQINRSLLDLATQEIIFINQLKTLPATIKNHKNNGKEEWADKAAKEVMPMLLDNVLAISALLRPQHAPVQHKHISTLIADLTTQLHKLGYQLDYNKELANSILIPDSNV